MPLTDKEKIRAVENKLNGILCGLCAIRYANVIVSVAYNKEFNISICNFCWQMHPWLKVPECIIEEF